MENTQNSPNRGEAQRIFVRADEVDAGTAILSPSKQLPLSALTPADAAAPAGARPKAPPSRPSLKRDGSAAAAAPPPPPAQPPPALPNQHFSDTVTDSLSLPQLKQLVNQFPKLEQRAYAFQYVDAQGFADEVEELFHYTEQDRHILLCSRDTFEQMWKSWCRRHKEYFEDDGNEYWLDAEHVHAEFLEDVIDRLRRLDVKARIEALECLHFILTGVWSLTAGQESAEEYQGDQVSDKPDRARWNTHQITWIHRGADLLVECHAGVGVFHLYSLLQDILNEPYQSNAVSSEEQAAAEVLSDEELQEVTLGFSCLSILLESARVRKGTESGEAIRKILQALEPSFLLFLVGTISRFRWDESSNIPLTPLLQLFWKSLLVFFGDVKRDLEHVKGILQPRIDPFSAEASHPVLTASPLDYHFFRQEITSKYPAYNPPLPLVPLEMDNKSMLPPLPHHLTKLDGMPGNLNGQGTTVPGAGGSIMHQPVHIATPAPSPPPSPIGPGGKAGKKQNYQTNQNFPFLYPPLDDSSNLIGGSGTTEFQDLMVGKKWEGSDIPTSIIEAGELFASRMRMTRAMRQLWRERDLFLQYDRGWKGSKSSALNGTSKAIEGETPAPASPMDVKLEEDERKIVANESLDRRMTAVERFFHHALPNLQSLVIVMMKVMLRNVQEIAMQNGNMPDQSQANGLNRNKSNLNMAQTQSLPMPPAPPQPSEMAVEDLENVRSREISQKAICAAIFVLLKWLKVSHVLKFEYLTQLLLDANYLQLTLKYFAHQNLEDLVAINYDREEFGFFHFCHLNSDHPPLSPTSPQADSDSSSADEAVPPPIMRHLRSPPSEVAPRIASPMQMDGTVSEDSTPSYNPESMRPSVDELGNPLAPYPPTPITDFSFRQFQTSIHLLRILQKVTRSKAHRILLMVQFKSSQILRRILRVPDPMMRLYVLKLFKSQVPYCGRKWRQSNMRVITAIYLHCRPELRDEWLAGMHDSAVEGEVDEAVPLEWALRGLTYWWQKRMYPDVMKLRDKAGNGGGQEIESDERDFFQRELDNMGWGVAGLGLGDDVAFGEEAPGANGSPLNNGEVHLQHQQQQQHQQQHQQQLQHWDQPQQQQQPGTTAEAW